MTSSKNSIVLLLTINLVLFGFTVGQAPAPQAPMCPRDLQACVNVFNIVSVFINTTTVRPCCLAVAGLSTSLASVCICNAVKVTIPNFATLIVSSRALQLCGVSPPPGFNCA